MKKFRIHLPCLLPDQLTGKRVGVMRKMFFPKLAAGNLRKNAKIYFPFILTCVVTVAMFYIICALSHNRSIDNQNVLIMLELASQVSAVFAVIFLFYTNSFLMKRRKMELGLYNILGMDKKHIALTIIWETVLIASVSLALGMTVGIALNKLMFLTVTKIIGGTVTLGFEISTPAIASALVLFAVIFVLILLNSLRQIYFSKPVELLKGGQTGEREPKAKWLMAVLGIASLGAGYYIAIATKNPVEVINMFFFAVILVIVGTYMLFTSGSIALLKLLRNNKRYYYKTKHFISVSGMIYRMKQNAAGLGNICILSTAVLVMISTTLSLYIGLEDVLRTRYPQSFSLETNEIEYAEQLSVVADEVLREKNLVPQNKVGFRYFGFAAWENGDTFTPDTDNSGFMSLEQVRTLIVITLEEYNKMTDKPQSLAEGEILLYSNRGSYRHDTFSVFNEHFTVKEKIGSFLCGDIMASDLAGSHYVIVRDEETFVRLYEAQKIAYGEKAMSINYRYAFDLDSSSEAVIEADSLIRSRLLKLEPAPANGFSVVCRETERAEFLGIYGGLFFIGIFLGILFIMATVLIIYYKQITEGYVDKERFIIMKNVGLSRAEIKNTVRSQILTVFFLPLVTAGLHISAAFPSLTQMLKLLNLTNVPLFIMCTLVCFAVFAIFYTIVYSLTARTYYRIVG